MKFVPPDLEFRTIKFSLFFIPQHLTLKTWRKWITLVSAQKIFFELFGYHEGFLSTTSMLTLCLLLFQSNMFKVLVNNVFEKSILQKNHA